MNRYKISLIVPVYGVERYIRQSAESVLEHTKAKIKDWKSRT